MVSEHLDDGDVHVFSPGVVWWDLQAGKTALQLAEEVSGHPATADAIRPFALLLLRHKELRESACSGDLAAVKAVLGVAGLNVDAADAVGVDIYICVCVVCVL